MARYTGPKNKKSRHIGSDLELKTSPAKLQRRLGIVPGQHGRRGHGKVSDFGLQLKEKQKVKWMYGLMERQFRRYFNQAAKTKHATGESLLQHLETRLDNVIYRLRLAPTRSAARQLVTHGHVLVNNQKTSTPSYEVQVNDLITLSAKALKTPQTSALLAQKNLSLPSWLNKKAVVGKVVRLPQRTDIDADINEQLIVEFYSR